MNPPNQKYIVEARDDKGNLIFDCEQPPAEWISGVTIDQMYQYFFCNHPHAESTTWKELIEWFNSKSWYVRPKTW